MWKSEFSRLIRRDFESRQTKNQLFSLRSYAKKLGLAASTLFYVLQDKGTLNIKRAKEILPLLKLTEAETERFLVIAGEQKELQKSFLKEEEEFIFKDWKVRALLIYHDLEKGLPDHETLIRKLDVSTDWLSKNLQNLCDAGFLVRVDGQTKRNPNYISTEDGPGKESIKEFHRSNLALASDALSKISSERRDYSALTFACSEEELAFLREEIRSLYERVIAVSAGKKKDRVLQMNVFLHPVDLETKQC